MKGKNLHVTVVFIERNKGYVWSSKQGKHLKDMQHTIYPEAIIDSKLGNN